MYIVQSNKSILEAVYDNSLTINPSLGMYQYVHSNSAMNIGSIKINTSLMMIKE